MNSLCFEHARLSREATAAQKKLERPLKPQAVKTSASTNHFRVWKPREATAAQKKLEQAIAAKIITHTYSLHKMTQTDNLEATEATFYQEQKSYTGE